MLWSDSITVVNSNHDICFNSVYFFQKVVTLYLRISEH